MRPAADLSTVHDDPPGSYVADWPYVAMDARARRQLDALVARLAAALERGQATTAARLLDAARDVDPGVLVDLLLARHDRRLDPSLWGSADDPRVEVLRCCVVALSMGGGYEPLEARLLAAIDGCLELELGAWADLAANCWTQVVQHLGIGALAWSHGRALWRARGPQLVRAHPVVVAALAVARSVAGDEAGAEEMWAACTSHGALVRDPDARWMVHYNHMWCAIAAGDFDVVRMVPALRMAIGHYASRRGVRHWMQLSNASMNLAWLLLWTGRPGDAYEVLDAMLDTPSLPGEIVAYAAGIQALASVRLGDVARTEQHLEVARTAVTTDVLQPIAAHGVTAILAARRGDVDAVFAAVDAMRSEEVDVTATNEARAEWRLLGASALLEVDRLVAARALLVEAAPAARPSPIHELHRRILLCDIDVREAVAGIGGLDAVHDHARRVVEIAAALPDGAGIVARTWGGAGLQAVALAHRVGELPDELAGAVAMPGFEAAAEAVDGLLADVSGCDASGLVPDAGRMALRITLLGDCSVERGGQLLDTAQWSGRRQARLVVARLAAARGDWVEKDVLAEGIWGDPSPSEAAKRLPPVLHAVRQVLDGDLAPGGTARLQSNGTALALRLLPGDTCDLHVFLELVERARAARIVGASGNLAAMAFAMPIDAVLAGQGDSQLVEEVRWIVLDEASRLAVRIAHVVDERATAARLLPRVAWLQSVQPDDERLTAATMRLAARAGEGAAIDAAFRRHRTALAEMADVPSIELSEIRQACAERAAA